MIRIDGNFISINHYYKILKVSISEIQISMKQYNIFISGQELYICLLNRDEIIIKGLLLKVEFIYEGL